MKAISEANQPAISYFKDNHFEKTQEAYQDALDHIAEASEAINPPISLNQSIDLVNAHSTACNFSLSQMPTINLLPFNGEYDKWENFRDRFISLIIQNKDLRNFARMQYLVSSLTGSALECISDLKVTAENFDIAWQALVDCFENKRWLIGVHLLSLLNLPSVPRESASDLRVLLSKANFVALNNLRRELEKLWHDMLVYLVIQKVDSATRKSWNAKVSESNNLPIFNDFCKFIKKSRARPRRFCYSRE